MCSVAILFSYLVVVVLIQSRQSTDHSPSQVGGILAVAVVRLPMSES
jgi:hypothetical protein